MGLIDEIRQKGAEGRLTEEVLYAEVLREMEAGIRRDGLWAKAFSEAGGEEAPSKARYIKLRVQALRDEARVALVERQRQEVMERKKQEFDADTQRAESLTSAAEDRGDPSGMASDTVSILVGLTIFFITIIIAIFLIAS